MTITILELSLMFEIEFDIAIDFEIDIENVRNTRYRDHGGQFNEEELPKSLFINLMVMK
jgi:hypothetical protein